MNRAAFLAALLLCPLMPARAAEIYSGAGAVLRALDKITGDLADIPIKPGETLQIGRLHVKLDDCRYEVEGEAQKAYAFLNIEEPGIAEPHLFSGWMSADSPALNPLDHPRYDIWLVRCSSE